MGRGKFFFLLIGVLFLGLGLLACSSPSSSTTTADEGGGGGGSGIEANRVFVVTAPTAVLTPNTSTLESSGDLQTPKAATAYLLSLSVSGDNLVWYEEGPDYGSGTTDLETYAQTTWPSIYGDIPPNAVMDAYLGTNPLNEGFTLTLSNPQYDSANRKLVFNAWLLDTSVDNLGSDETLDLKNVKVTILKNNTNNQEVQWSLANLAERATWEAQATGGQFLIHLQGVDAESFFLSHAPERQSHMSSTDLVAKSWTDRYGSSPPSGALTAFLADGTLAAFLVTIDQPVYDASAEQLTYTLTLHHGNVVASQELTSPSLVFDSHEVSASCGTGFSRRLVVCNNCGDDVLMFLTRPGLLPEQWNFWNDYGDKVPLNPSYPDNYVVKTKLLKGETKTFCIPDKGAPSGNFHFSTGCDDSDFGNCILGSQPGYDLWSVQTLFEPTFGCRPGTAVCAQNTATDPYSDLASDDYMDISTVDGFTLPISFEITNPTGLDCTRTSGNTEMLDLASCPSETYESLHVLDSDTAQKNKLAEQGAQWVIDLLNKDSRGYRACNSPCKWFTSSQLGTPTNPSILTADSNPPNTSSWYCCAGKCGEDPEVPSSCTCPGCGGTQCVKGPNENGTYPIATTNYVRRLKEMGYTGYTWQYDDFEGLQKCSWGVVAKITLCPGKWTGTKPYNMNRTWQFNGSECIPDETGAEGAYASLFECQKANLRYKCVTETLDAEKLPPGVEFKYCQVDADGTMTYDQCQDSCK